MIQQGFKVGNNKWYVMCAYEIKTKQDEEKVVDLLVSSGYPEEEVGGVLNLLCGTNSGFTFSDLNQQVSVVITGPSSCPAELYDTVQHELKHVVEHISDYYDIDPKSEDSAYLQGEIAKNMFLAVAPLLCPNCAEH